MARTKQVAKPHHGTAGMKRKPKPRRHAKASARSKRREKMPKEQRELRFEDTELKEVHTASSGRHQALPGAREQR